VEVLAGSMEGKHSVKTCTLTVNDQEIPTHALIDCGATGIAFMDQDFAPHHQITLQEIKEKRHVEAIDGRSTESGDISHIAKVGMMIQDLKDQLLMSVTKLGQYPMLVGCPCLQLHDNVVRFASNTDTFGSQYCTTRSHDIPLTIQWVTKEPPEPVCPQNEGISEQQIHLHRSFRGNIVMLNKSSFFRTLTKGKHMVFKASPIDIDNANEAKDHPERLLEGIVPK